MSGDEEDKKVPEGEVSRWQQEKKCLTRRSADENIRARQHLFLFLTTLKRDSAQSGTQALHHFSLSHRIFVLDTLVPLLDESRAAEITTAYTDELLETMKMERLGPLEIYPAIDLSAPGWSWIQPISTSHTSGHYWSAPGRPNLHIDAYSCMPFSHEDIIRVAHKHFGLLEWTASLVHRDLDPRKRLTLQLRGRGDAILDQVVLTAGKETPARVPTLARVR